jgi:hypothetical protein
MLSIYQCTMAGLNMDDEIVCKVGDEIVGPLPAVFELVVSDHVQWTDPRAYGLDRDGINPADYFVTSGDAVEKARVLDKDLWRLAGDLRKEMFNLIAAENDCDLLHAHELYRSGVRPQSLPGFGDYEAAVWRAAGQARKLLSALKKAKGSNIFLETEWNNHTLLCIPKNPRR